MKQITEIIPPESDPLLHKYLELTDEINKAEALLYIKRAERVQIVVAIKDAILSIRPQTPETKQVAAELDELL